MSVQTEIDRLKATVTKALHAISQKGVTIPANSNSDNLVALIKQIKAMGSFTIDGTSFPFELGMTWGEYLESNYNTDGQLFLMDDDGFILYNAQLLDDVGLAVYKNDSIIDGMAYKT